MRSDIKKFWPSNFKVTRIIKSIHLEYLPECTDIFVINKTQNYQQPAFSVHSDTHLCRIEASIFWKCSQKWIKFYKHKMIITTWRALEKNLINITKNPHTGKHFSPQFFANQPTGSNIFRKFISSQYIIGQSIFSAIDRLGIHFYEFSKMWGFQSQSPYWFHWI